MKTLLILLFGATLLLSSIDINNANAKELTSLKGVGLKKAERIITYRNSHKCFKTLKELTKVKGIGESIFLNNKENLKLGLCKKK